MNETIPEVEGEVCIPISVSEQIELCYARGWTDGLPVVPASRALVDAMLDANGLTGRSLLQTDASVGLQIKPEALWILLARTFDVASIHEAVIR